MKPEQINKIMERVSSKFIGLTKLEMSTVRISILAARDGDGKVLDADSLLAESDADFMHDVGGLVENVCRETNNVGLLLWGFIPRCGMKADDDEGNGMG